MKTKKINFLLWNRPSKLLLQTGKYLLLGTLSAGVTYLLPYGSNPGASIPLQVAQNTAEEIPNVIVIPGERINGNKPNDSSRTSTVTPQTSSGSSVSTLQTPSVTGVTVNTNSLSITLYDNGSADGDIVKISVNGQSPVGLDSVQLTNIGQTFYISLEPGINIVGVTALNDGSSAPNTATLVIEPSQVVLGSNVLDANQSAGSTAYVTILTTDIFDNCKAKDNLSDIANSFISRCRKASIRVEFPSELLGETLGNINKGKQANYKRAWKLLNDKRFEK